MSIKEIKICLVCPLGGCYGQVRLYIRGLDKNSIHLSVIAENGYCDKEFVVVFVVVERTRSKNFV